MLFLIATPIGNLSDISFRAVDILRSVDLILCEDTRHSKGLLKHYAIDRPLKSFHKFNEGQREDAVIQQLKQGAKIAVISDAGTPGIADPSARLVARARDEGLDVQAIPGACALICALVASGLPTDRFQFLGFLPKQKQALKRTLQHALRYAGTTVFYESPQRLLGSLALVAELAPRRQVAIARELTKQFEEADRGSAVDLFTRWQERSVKGECVLLLGPMEGEEDFSDWAPAQHVQALMEVYGCSKQDALKLAAQERGIPKRLLYQQLLDEKAK